MLQKIHTYTRTCTRTHTTERQQFPVNGAVIKCSLMDSTVRGEDGQKEEEAETWLGGGRGEGLESLAPDAIVCSHAVWIWAQLVGPGYECCIFNVGDLRSISGLLWLDVRSEMCRRVFTAPC